MNDEEVKKTIRQAYINALTNTMKILMRKEERRVHYKRKAQ